MHAATHRSAALVEPKPLTNKERRRHPREAVARACKVYQPATGRFASARTIDLSAGGALLEIDATRAPEPGDEVDLGLTWLRAGILAGDSMIRSRVVRARPAPAGHHVVALEFARSVAQAA